MELQQYTHTKGGLVLYEGPSCLDNQPIVMIATLSTSNEKTGDMIQTWILRADMHPLDAVRQDADESICGQCQHRGSGAGKNRSCYVVVSQAPSNIWRTWRAGKYKKLAVSHDNPSSTLWLQNRKLRCGAYGDPAAVPFSLWEVLLTYVSGWTGYTHQWRTCPPEYSRFCMASADSEEDAREAHSLGWRTFRVKDPDSPIISGEFVCPASQEQTYRKDCASCLACAGTRFQKLGNRAGNVVINVHGSKAKLSAWKSRNDQIDDSFDNSVGEPVGDLGRTSSGETLRAPIEVLS